MAEPTDAQERRAALAYAEVVRSLEIQERSLESLRTRSAAVLTIAFVLAGFAANAIAAGNRAGWWFTGLGLTGLSAAMSIGAGWPVRLFLTNDGYVLVQDYVRNQDQTVVAMYADLAIYGQSSRDANERRLRLRRWLYIAAAFLLLAEGLAFLLAARV